MIDMVLVVKANGEKEKFDKNKIIKTIKRVGVDHKTAMQIASRIESTVKEGESTHDVYKKILIELNKLENKSPFDYRLRESVAHLGPMVFERYVKKILEFNGFKCKLDQIIKGEFVSHEVDVVAQKDGKTLLVECKRHVNPHRYTSLGVVLTVWARMDDINKNKSGKYNFTGSWVVTNTKFSQHAIDYAKGKNMLLTGWNISKEHNLDNIITKDKLYPVTILSAEGNTIGKLIDNDIITIQDVLKAKTLPVSREKAQDLISQAQKLSI